MSGISAGVFLAFTAAQEKFKDMRWRMSDASPWNSRWCLSGLYCGSQEKFKDMRWRMIPTFTMVYNSWDRNIVCSGASAPRLAAHVGGLSRSTEA
jgi:hypothetical protein